MSVSGVTIHPLARVIGLDHIRFGAPVIIDDFVMIYAKAMIDIGNYCHIAAFSSVIASREIELADFVAVSHGARLLTATDDFKGHGFGNSTVPTRCRNLKCGPIRVGRFCIVGANSVVLPGVTIGEGATVGAGSVVTRDLLPWGVYIGNRRVGERDRVGVLSSYADFMAARESGQ